ncbi:unnamed protein product [Mytilus coruscus]|uniref:Uncharacterized protein n=1 Tax=Mytilus coruscus TaxID=42192 RepID=A0A6J8AHQ6_MYTCO|nr:unnamed protein product [Mytilus coruscus]
MKSGKAAGIDGLQVELLKADINTATVILHGLFKDIWEENKIPEDWAKGLIVKLYAEERIDSELDDKLRQEQAGFRKGKGCIDQIFALKNIIEQCIEWKTPLYINIIDFKKAFDSLHRETLWAMLMSYGVPHKIIIRDITTGDEDMAEARPVLTDVGGIPKFDANGEINSIGPRWNRWKRGFELFAVGKGVVEAEQKKALL